MKKLLGLIPLLIISMSTQAQDQNKVRELGFTFSDFNGFSLFYRSGDAQAVWRYTLNNIRVNLRPTSGTNVSDAESYGLALAVGRESRKALNEKLQLRYGPELAGSFNGFNNQFSDDAYNVGISYTLALRAVFGLNYSLNKNVFIGIEVLPQMAYTASEVWSQSSVTNEELYRSTQQFDLTIRNSTFLSLGWRF